MIAIRGTGVSGGIAEGPVSIYRRSKPVSGNR